MILLTIDITSDLGQMVCYSLCLIVVKCNLSGQELFVNVSYHNEIRNLSLQMLLSWQSQDKFLLEWPNLLKV